MGPTISPNSLNDPAIPIVAPSLPSLASEDTAASLFVQTVPIPSPATMEMSANGTPFANGISTMVNGQCRRGDSPEHGRPGFVFVRQPTRKRRDEEIAQGQYRKKNPGDLGLVPEGVQVHRHEAKEDADEKHVRYYDEVPPPEDRRSQHRKERLERQLFLLFEWLCFFFHGRQEK